MKNERNGGAFFEMELESDRRVTCDFITLREMNGFFIILRFLSLATWVFWVDSSGMWIPLVASGGGTLQLCFFPL